MPTAGVYGHYLSWFLRHLLTARAVRAKERGREATPPATPSHPHPLYPTPPRGGKAPPFGSRSDPSGPILFRGYPSVCQFFPLSTYSQMLHPPPWGNPPLPWGQSPPTLGAKPPTLWGQSPPYPGANPLPPGQNCNTGMLLQLLPTIVL